MNRAATEWSEHQINEEALGEVKKEEKNTTSSKTKEKENLAKSHPTSSQQKK